jgi:hypothetical protein
VPVGREASERGGVIDPADVRGAGMMEWGSLVGVSVDHPLVGSGDRGFDINDRWSRVVTRPSGQAGPAADTIATPDGAPRSVGHWRDVFNFRGSPLPYVLIALIVIFYLSHLRLRASGEVGGFGKHVRAGAALE